MSVEFLCPSCSYQLEAELEHVGQDLNCPQCHVVVSVPSPEPVGTDSNDSIDMAFGNTKITEYINGLSTQLDSKSPQAEQAPLSFNSTDEHYSLHQMIAEGGMGRVLEAQDLNLRRKVAMKVMKVESKDLKSRDITRFVREAQITGQLEHPNIIPLHDIGLNKSGNLYYTMKKVHGRTLEDIIDKLYEGDEKTVAEYPLSVLLDIFVKSCDAIAFAHSRGVVHRDLKPENIMVGDFGEVLVLDWGIAKVLSEHEENGVNTEALLAGIDENEFGNTMDGDVLGTPAFMSPEQAYGQHDKTCPATDVYALGGILYNLLTLRRSLGQTKSVQQMMLNLVQGNINPCSYWNPGGQAEENGITPPDLQHLPNGTVPTALEAIVTKSMSLEAKDRYLDAQEILNDISKYRRGYATDAEGANLRRQFELLIQRHQKAFIATASAILLFLFVGLFFVINLNIQKNKALKAQRSAEVATRRAEQSKVKAQAAYRETLQALDQVKIEKKRADEALLNFEKAQTRALEAEMLLEQSNDRKSDELSRLYRKDTLRAKELEDKQKALLKADQGIIDVKKNNLYLTILAVLAGFLFLLSFLSNLFLRLQRKKLRKSLSQFSAASEVKEPTRTQSGAIALPSKMAQNIEQNQQKKFAESHPPKPEHHLDTQEAKKKVDEKKKKATETGFYIKKM